MSQQISRPRSGRAQVHRALQFRQSILGICLVFVTGFCGCDWRDDLDGSRRTPEGLAESRPAPTTATGESVSVPPGDVEHKEDALIDLMAARPLLDGYRNGALIINAGSPAFVKYIDGGLRGDWKRGINVVDDQGVSEAASLVEGLAAEVYFPYDKESVGISVGESVTFRFRARSAIKKQLVSVFLNEKKIADLSMPTTDWQSYSIPASAAHLEQGGNKLRFYFRSTGDIEGVRSAAAFSRFVIGASISEEDAFTKRMVGEAGDRRIALATTGESRLSYYLKIPDVSTNLQVSVSGEGQYALRIRGETDREAVEKLGNKASPEWKEINLSLRNYHGQIVRVDLLGKGNISWSGAKIMGTSREEAERNWQTPRRIILWSVSSLRSDAAVALRAQGFRKFLDENFAVPDLQASVPSAGGAHATLMSGRFRVRGTIPEEWPTLAEHLQSAGYSTALFSGNGFVTDLAGHSQGYSHYDNPMRRQHHYGASTLWRSAKRYLLKHQKQRVFVHIAAVEAHVPYRPSDQALRREWAGAPLFSAAKTLSLAAQLVQSKRAPSVREASYIRALYDACVSDSSTAFSDMLNELEELNLEGPTAIVLAGDHGEEIWERGGYGHGESLYQESLQTPFAIRYPGIAERKAPALASTLDILPTIMDLAGIEDASQQGMSMLRNSTNMEDRPIVSGIGNGARALRLGRYKLIRQAGGWLELYDLKQDPRELTNVYKSKPVLARALRIVMATFVAYEQHWSTPRWGQPSAPLEAFASDQGM